MTSSAAYNHAYYLAHPEHYGYKPSFYLANRERILARTRLWRKAHPDNDQKRVARWRAVVDAALAGGCVDCGTTELVVLDFDHVRGEKTSRISRMRGASIPRLLAEIAKCEVRCANCHRRVTALRRKVI